MSGAVIVAFVYLGGKLPKYARNNLSMLVKEFPNLHIVLISDNLENNIFEEIEFFLFDDSSMMAELVSRSSLDSEFRKGFWIHTLARFSALATYMASKPKIALIHFELDVWIADNFPFQLFENLTVEAAYSLPAPTEGSAAVLYLKDYEASLKLSELIYDSIRVNPGSTDMAILREIYDNHLMDVKVLPISPSEGIDESDVFNGYLFDPSTWGMYFLGQDPRNSRGLQIFHRQERHHLVHPRRYKVESDGRTINVIDHSRAFSLVNLHVHSKDLRIFSDKKRSSREIEKYLERNGEDEFSEFRARVFTQQIGKKILKELREVQRFFTHE